MNSRLLALTWLSGDLPFRPRYLAQEFVLRIALRDPVRAAEIVCELNDGSRSLSCGRYFAMSMGEYRRSPQIWRIHEISKWETQKAIDDRRRGPNRTFKPIRISPLPDATVTS